MRSLYAPFLALIPKGGHILDAGCGSGRDARAFLDSRYRVTAFDASAAMVTAASIRTQQNVIQMRFSDMAFVNEFDGIWTCASLLHIPRREIGNIFPRFIDALKPDGVWYMSFKEGFGEEISSGRLFNNYTESSLSELLSIFPELKVVQLWVTSDVRRERNEERWVNAIVKKL